jgi:CRISPR-associated endonuclease/helicase Cas3
MQAMLALQAGKPLAKSDLLPRDQSGFIIARDRSGFPRGGRHELISAGLIRQNPSLLNGASKDGAHDPDLVSHLVGTHHGYARPFAPVVRDDANVSIKLEIPPLSGNNRHGLESLGSGWTDQFWSLVQRYGYWGLCYLEAILRVADHRQSQEEQES